MKKRKKKNNIVTLITLILVPVIIYFGTIYIYDTFYGNQLPTVKKLVDEKKKDNYSDKDNKQDVSNYVNQLPEFRATYGNDDIQGKLEIPQLNISTLITRSTNNTFYLSNNLYKQHDPAGVPFFDYRNTSLVSNRQINIYGHNTLNPEHAERAPFVNLEAYTDKNIFDNYKTIYLSIDEKQIEYEVIALKILRDGNNEHMKLIFYSDEDYISHVNKLLNGSLYAYNATVTVYDRLLVLQACHYDPPGSYLLLICKEKK